MLTKEQRKQVEWLDLMIANEKTDEQKLAIELSQRDKRLERRHHAQQQAIKKHKEQERVIFINHLRKHLPMSEITPEIAEKEIDFRIITED